jgi:TetR/AcrR family fatty acid metabolism transcriptional regulator
MKNSNSNISTEKYDAIVQVAQRLFGEKGYQSVSLEEIARTAGVSKGLVNYHFGSKEDLLISVISGNKDILTGELDGIARSNETARHKMQAAMQAYLEAASSGLAIAQMAFIAFFEVAYTEKVRGILSTALDENLLKFVALVDEGIAKGELRPVDSVLTTHFVIGMALEMIRVATVQQQPLQPGKIAEEITGILFDGISR